jgi:ribokinase
MGTNNILVVGSANIDLVVMTERFPKPGETVLGKKFEMFPGGKGANQAVACAKLGGVTYFIGKMGHDDFQKILINTMKNDGVNIDHLLIDQNLRTGTAFIAVDENGENEIIVISGSNMRLFPNDIVENEEIFARIKVVLTQLEIPLETVMMTANLTKKYTKTFILNPAPARELPAQLLSVVDFLTPNESELEIISGLKVQDKKSAQKAAETLIRKGVKNVIVTLGENGALLVTSNRSKLFPARKVKPLDTTAAGDAFNGAFTFSLANDCTVERSIEFANIAAAISVTRMGAQSSMPSMQDIENVNETLRSLG